MKEESDETPTETNEEVERDDAGYSEPEAEDAERENSKAGLPEPEKAPDTSRSERRFQLTVAAIAAAAALLGGAAGGGVVNAYFQSKQAVANDVRSQQRDAYATFVADEGQLKVAESDFNATASLKINLIKSGSDGANITFTPSILERAGKVATLAGKLESDLALVQIIGSEDAVKSAESVMSIHRRIADSVSRANPFLGNFPPGFKLPDSAIESVDSSLNDYSAAVVDLPAPENMFIEAARSDLGLPPDN